MSAIQPVRLQLSRKKGFRLPPDTVVVSRPHDWGNPFVVGQYSDRDKLGHGTPEELCGVFVQHNAHAGALFRLWLHSLSDIALAWRISVHVLRGKNLACWCKLPAPGEPDICHAAELIRLANA